MPDKNYLNALAPGFTLHWYRVERVLGQGAFGITYLCHDVNLDRQVAVKEYLPNQLATRQGDHSVRAVASEQAEEFRAGLARFLAEARTLARFEHPNIVRVLNVFEANHTAYMVMNYEHGETLREVIGRRRTLPEPALRSLLMPLLDGLEHIHAAGFIHRDIKPANIFLRADGTPVLIDFGAARQAMLGDARTLTNFVSRGYAAIEQYSGKSDRQGPWTDIYGLGATLYRAMTGSMPADAVERSEAISHGTPDVMTRITSMPVTGYSRAFQAAIDHALAFRALDRPQTIAAWRREFELHDSEIPEGGGFATGDESATEPRDDATTEILSTSPPLSEGGSGAAAAAGPVPPASRRILFGALAAVLLAAGAAFLLRPPESQAPTPAAVSTGPGTAAPPSAADEARKSEPAAPTQPAAAAGIDELLAGARGDIVALRLTTPKGNNALEKYRQVLAMDPANTEAGRGIDAIADKYVELAYRDLQENNLDQARLHLDKAAELAPDLASIKDARTAIESRRDAAATATPADSQSLKDKVNEFERSFNSFLESQKQTPQQKSRADELRDRLGGK